jgi:hypothetical protein
MNPIYEAHRRQASALKLRAVTERARDPIVGACLFHEAERAEARALMALGPVDPVTRLRATVERCGLLLDARDVSSVLGERWPEVLDLSDALGPEAEPLLTRLRPAVEGLAEEHRQVVQELPVHLHLAAIHGTVAARRKTLGRLRGYVERFPGDWRAWQLIALTELALGVHAAAWGAVRTARDMAPEDEAGRLVELNVAIDALEPPHLHALCEQCLLDLFHGGASAELALLVASGFVALARRDEPMHAVSLDRARVACERGNALAPSGAEVQRYLRAMNAIVATLRAGKEPRGDILLRAGLHELAARWDGHTDLALFLRGARRGEHRGLRPDTPPAEPHRVAV